MAVPPAATGPAYAGDGDERAIAADVTRLAAFGDGRVEGGTPGVAAATGAQAAYGFGTPSCSPEGFAYSPLRDPRANVELTVPGDARRLELVMRSTFGERDLTVTLDGARLAVVRLPRAWSRVVVPLPTREDGAAEVGRRRARLRLTVGDPTPPLKDLPSMPAAFRALLHSVSTNTLAPGEAASVGAASPPTAGAPGLTLRPGERRLVAAPLPPGAALMTRGQALSGVASADSSGLRFEVRAVTPQGAITALASFPASFALPLNLDLQRQKGQAEGWIELALVGDAGASSETASLRVDTPVFTVPGAAQPSPALRPSGRGAARADVVLIALPGLDAETARAVGAEGTLAAAAPDATPLVPVSTVWTDAVEPGAAWMALLTGLAPATLGVDGRLGLLGAALPTLGSRLSEAGYKTIALGGQVPLPPEATTFETFDETLLATPETFRPHAAAVLAKLSQTRRTHHAVPDGADAPGPVAAAVVLGTAAPPYLPRTEAWTRFLPEGAKPAWKPLKTRERMAKWMRAGEPLPPGADRDTLRAFRLAEAAETVEAVADWLRDAGSWGHAPRVILVGLPASPGELLGPSRSPGALQAPVWTVGLADAAPPEGTYQLADVTAALLDAAGGPTDALQGHTPWAASHPAWPRVAPIHGGQRGDLVAWGEHLVQLPPTSPLADIDGDGWAHWQATLDGWRAKATRTAGDGVLGQLLRRQAAALAAGGASWAPRTHEPATLGGAPGFPGRCGD